MSQSEEGAGTFHPSNSVLREMMENCKSVFIDAWKYCQTDEEKRDLCAVAKLTMVKLARIEMMVKAGGGLIEEVKPITEPKDDNDVAAILKSVEDYGFACRKKREHFQRKLTDARVKCHPEYQILIQLIRNVYPQDEYEEGDTQDLDDSVAEAGASTGSELIPTQDPVTKQVLKDPVRNRKCLHIYGKQSMLELLRKKKNTRCPQLGCSNMVTKDDLVEEPGLAEKLERQKARTERYAIESSQKKKANKTTELE